MSMTPSGIEPATFRFAAQNLNHCATAVPRYSGNISNLTEALRKDLKEVQRWDCRSSVTLLRSSFYRRIGGAYCLHL